MNDKTKDAANVFDSNAESYSDSIDEALGKYGANHEFFTVHKAWLIRHLLQARGANPAGMRLLDVGCGVGKIHRYLGKDFAAISGVDISERSLEVAHMTYPNIDYRAYDGDHLPYDDRTFDLSIAICVFHHVPSAKWPQLAGEMLRVLKSGGLSLVIEHNPFNPVTRRIVNNCPLDLDAVLLRPSQLRRIFEQAGGASVETRTIVTVPPTNGFLKAVDRMMGVFPFGAQYYLATQRAN